MKNKYTIVEYKNKKYVIALTKKNDPFVFDEHNLLKVPNKMCYIHNGYASIHYAKKNCLLHHIIKPYNGISVDHINQIKTDNREVNLRYATQDVQNKNQSKRKRNVVLPEHCKIDPQQIPTFIWYIRTDGKHGDRWMVDVKHKYEWKTTSSKLLSTECKFELAKKHLRELIHNKPELFDGHCMNGQLNKDAEILKQEYIEILQLAGIKYIEPKTTNEDDLLLENLTWLTDAEKDLVRGEKSIQKPTCMNEVNNTNQHKNTITVNMINIEFDDQQLHKQYLLDCFNEFKLLTTNDLQLDSKFNEILRTKPNKEFETKIFNYHSLNQWSELDIKPTLEFCETSEQFSKYAHFRTNTSSLPTTGVIGRSIKILVKDLISENYIGIMCLSSDLYSLSERDSYLGLNEKNKNQFLKNLMNLSCCIPLQPFGFNTNGGKLIASLAFSKEVFEYFLKKYKEPLLGILTTSIN